jgi:hypothetical protein
MVHTQPRVRAWAVFERRSEPRRSIAADRHPKTFTIFPPFTIQTRVRESSRSFRFPDEGDEVSGEGWAKLIEPDKRAKSNSTTAMKQLFQIARNNFP